MAARPTALEVAAKALAHRDRSAANLTAYLERHGAAPDEASRAVTRLQEAGYVDDARYASSRAEALAGRGYGDDGIRFELDRDGVPADDVEAALASLPRERERALSLLGAARTPAAAARRLAAKGFSHDSIEAALAAIPDASVPGLNDG
jgi:SOS response regulatory protein OraA/RecX